jgi:hypothetical protein
MLHAQLPSPLVQSRTPATVGGSPHLSQCSQDHSLQACPEACPEAGSRLCRDDPNHHSHSHRWILLSLRPGGAGEAPLLSLPDLELRRGVHAAYGCQKAAAWHRCLLGMRLGPVPLLVCTLVIIMHLFWAQSPPSLLLQLPRFQILGAGWAGTA